MALDAVVEPERRVPVDFFEAVLGVQQPLQVRCVNGDADLSDGGGVEDGVVLALVVL